MVMRWLKADDAAPMHAATLGVGRRSFGNIDTRQREHAARLAKRYGRWVYRCVTINAKAAAAVQPRLFAVDRDSDVRAKYFGRPVSKRDKAWLRGDTQPDAVKAMARGTDKLVELDQHPFLDLMRDVNPHEEGFHFRQGVYTDLQLFGSHFWHIIEGNGGPSELWRLLPQLTTPMPDPIEFVKGYTYGRAPEEQTYERDEVVWFKEFNPNDPWSGMSPLEAWLATVDADFAIGDFRADFMRRGGAPDWMLRTPAEMSSPAKRSFRSAFRRMFGNWAHRQENIAFMSGDAELHRLSDSPRELDFNASTEQVRDEIANAFGVPKALLTSDDVNLANAREGSVTHMRLTIWPMLCRVAETINQRFIPRYWGDGYVMTFDNPIQEDRALRVTERRSKLESGWSVNEIREEDGDARIEEDWADEPMMTSAVQPGRLVVESAETRATASPFMLPPGAPPPIGDPPEEEPDDIEEEGGDVVTDVASDGATAAGGAENIAEGEKLNGAQITAAKDVLADVAAGVMGEVTAIELLVAVGIGRAVAETMVRDALAQAGKRPTPPEEGVEDNEKGQKSHGTPPITEQSHRAAWHKAWDGAKAGDLPGTDVPESHLIDFRRRMAEVFEEQAERVARELGTNGAQRASEVLNEAQWLDRIESAARPMVMRAIEQGGNAASGVLPDGIWDVANPEVQRFVQRWSVQLAEAVQGHTRHRLSAMIGDGLERGETIPELSARVREWGGGDVGANRAEMIARTETARAYSAGEETAWAQSGVVVGKKWLLAPDPCQYCKAVAEKFGHDKNNTVPLGRPYLAGGQTLVGTEGGRMRLDYGDIVSPPVHPNCRCSQVPVFEGEE